MVSPAFYSKLTLLWTEQGWWLLSKPDDKRLIRCSWHPESTSVSPRAARDMERRTAVYRPREPSHVPPASAGPGSTPAPQAAKAAWTPTSSSFAVSGRGNFSSGWARTIPRYTVRTSRQINRYLTPVKEGLYASWAELPYYNHRQPLEFCHKP